RAADRLEHLVALVQRWSLATACVREIAAYDERTLGERTPSGVVVTRVVDDDHGRVRREPPDLAHRRADHLFLVEAGDQEDDPIVVLWYLRIGERAAQLPAPPPIREHELREAPGEQEQRKRHHRVEERAVEIRRHETSAGAAQAARPTRQREGSPAAASRLRMPGR